MPYKDRAKHNEAHRRYNRKRWRTDKVFRDRRNAVRRSQSPEARKAQQLARVYGISADDYALLLREQNGVCAICHRPEETWSKGVKRYLAVDHDHETKEVRGLLCGRCNPGLGYFQDDILRLEAAIRYLRGQH